MEKEVVLTEDGKKKLTEELEHLRTVKRKEVAERLKTAIGYGDLTENSEYNDAKNEQAYVEGRIDQLETILAKAHVISKRSIKTKEVGVGSLVEIREVGKSKKEQYRVVGSEEANPEKQMISYESPLGQALMGAEVGDIVEVSAPAGDIRYRMLSIKK